MREDDRTYQIQCASLNGMAFLGLGALHDDLMIAGAGFDEGLKEAKRDGEHHADRTDLVRRIFVLRGAQCGLL